jgi:hypothetical protein
MIKKLTRHGNSWALVIDKPVLELLDIDPESSPARSTGRRRKFEASLKKANRKYGKTLRKLAE